MLPKNLQMQMQDFDQLKYYWQIILLQRRVWSMVQIWSGQPSVGKIVFVDTTCTMAA